MSMNKFHPAMAGGEVSVTGTLEIQTDIQNLDYAQVCLAGDSVAAAANVSYSRVARTPGDGGAKIILKVWKADGVTAADVAVKVAWTAFGK